jgi:hypothetical protein
MQTSCNCGPDGVQAIRLLQGTSRSGARDGRNCSTVNRLMRHVCSKRPLAAVWEEIGGREGRVPANEGNHKSEHERLRAGPSKSNLFPLIPPSRPDYNGIIRLACGRRCEARTGAGNRSTSATRWTRRRSRSRLTTSRMTVSRSNVVPLNRRHDMLPHSRHSGLARGRGPPDQKTQGICRLERVGVPAGCGCGGAR